jgi:CO/xanthine dehydrogenase Mo-binding subunit
LDICAERLGLDPFAIRRINAMRDGAFTHTKQRLGSVSLLRALDVAEEASRWAPGPPTSRGATRSDVGGEGTRPPCALGARFAAGRSAKLGSEVA